MRIDRQIAVSAGWIAGPAFGVALMGASGYFQLSHATSGALFYGGLAVFFGTLLLVLILSTTEKDARRKKTVGPFILMGLGLAVLGGGIAWYFWPSAARVPDSTAVAQLAELGWGVQPGKETIRFELSSRPLPPMQKSADLFRALGTNFSVQLQSLPNLDGLHYLSDIDGLDTLGISAGKFTDISEIKDFRHLRELSISQTPIDGRSAVDSSPLADLVNLHKLNLYATKIVTLQPLRKLTKLRELHLRDTWVSDLSPLSYLTELQSLDITDVRGGDLSPLSHCSELVELGLGVDQIPGLMRLTPLKKLMKLRIISHGNVDLGPVGALPNLENLWVWAGVSRFDVAPLRNLTKLRELTLSVLGMGRLAPVDNIAVLGELKELRSVTLSELQITDLAFIENLHLLQEINLSAMPISSLEPLRGLKNLKKISINALQIVDISPLMDLPELTELQIMRTPARADILAALERRGVKVQSN